MFDILGWTLDATRNQTYYYGGRGALIPGTCASALSQAASLASIFKFLFVFGAIFWKEGIFLFVYNSFVAVCVGLRFDQFVFPRCSTVALLVLGFVFVLR